MKTTTITTAELASLIQSRVPFALLEALPERYYQEGHLPGALHFPHTEVGARAKVQLPNKALRIVVYCASETCRNSHVAAALLSNLGYESVAVYAEGKAGWVAAGHPLERAAALSQSGSPTFQTVPQCTRVTVAPVHVTRSGQYPRP